MWLRIVIGIAFFVVAIWVGVAVLRALAHPAGTDSDADVTDVEDKNLRYRCSVCGLEIKMTRAPGEGVKAPRHCGEGMELVK